MIEKSICNYKHYLPFSPGEALTEGCSSSSPLQLLLLGLESLFPCSVSFSFNSRRQQKTSIANLLLPSWSVSASLCRLLSAQIRMYEFIGLAVL